MVPQVTGRVLDRAMQVYGAEGICQDQLLAEAYAQSRTLRIADGPDEVHLLYLRSFNLAYVIVNLAGMKSGKQTTRGKLTKNLRKSNLISYGPEDLLHAFRKWIVYSYYEDYLYPYQMSVQTVRVAS